MKKEYTIRRMFLSVLLGTLIVVCVSGCGKDTAYYAESETLDADSELDSIDKHTESAMLQESESETALYVYICGQIKNPGVYKLPEGSRIIDLFTEAGGLTKKAAKEYWNQAQLLEDGQMYYVPTKAEASSQEQNNPEYKKEESSSDGKVNINTASKEQLMTIPGIGEAKANAILTYRKNHGSFSTIEEIKKVEGIKDGVFEKIKNYIKIN